MSLGARATAGSGVDHPLVTEPESPSEPTATWTAAAVARRIGVAPATLRSWSARYGIGPPAHQRGRYRRYSSRDIAELETVRRLHRDGMPMATAVEIARTRRRLATPSGEPVTERHPEPLDVAGLPHTDDRASPAAALPALLAAVRDLDSPGAVRILQHALTRHGVADTWHQLCRPALTSPILTTGAGDTADPQDPTRTGLDPVACIDVECVLVWAITTSLRRLAPTPPAADDRGSVLLACTDGELHTLGIDVLLAALDERGIPARTLGPSVPTPALLRAAERTRPATVFVWAQTPDTADPAVLTDLRMVTTRVVAAGPGWSAGTLVPGIDTADDLEHALAHSRTRR